jgi:hypothetical protein
MKIIDEIADAWGWRGVRPQALVMQNEFGNVIFTNQDGQYWRICPEELACEIVAKNEDDFVRLQNTSEFLNDWAMGQLVEQARSMFGIPSADRCYCLKIPATLGGAYTLANIATIARTELISVSGQMAKQIDDVPDGAQVRLKVTD